MLKWGVGVELYIFDRDLNFKGLLDSYFSLRWVRRYHRAGEFELHCALTTEKLNLLQRGHVLWKKGDPEAGYIEYRQLGQDQQGKEMLAIKGRFLTGYLDRRIVWGQENLNMTAERAMRLLVDKNCINPLDADRVIPLLVLGELKDYPETVNRQTSYKNLLEELENLSLTSELGYRVLVDLQAAQLTFDVYQGKDLTAGQNINPPAIFATEFENVFEQQFIDSLNNYRSLALVAGEGEGQDRQLVTVGSGAGLDRYELFVDARDLQSRIYEEGQETPIPPVEYQAMLVERGRTKLAEYQELQTFESKINSQGNLRYKQDFDLGDIVTCISKKWGVTVDSRITEIEEVYERGSMEVYCMFGNSVPTLVDKIRQAVR